MRVSLPLIYDSAQRTSTDTTSDAVRQNTYLTKEAGAVVINSRPGLNWIFDSNNTYTAMGVYATKNFTEQGTLFLYWDGTDWDMYKCDGLNTPAKAADVPAFTGDNNNHIVNWAEAGYDSTYYQIAFSVGNTNAFVYDFGSTITEITDANFPGAQAGLVWLDNYLVACDGQQIASADNGDPFTWTASSVLTPQSQQSTGTYRIVLHQNHIAAFGPYSIEFLYDNGNPTGSPFSVRTDLLIQGLGMWTHQAALGFSNIVGMHSFVDLDGGKKMAFLSQTKRGLLGAHVLENFQARKISNVKIDRYLNYIETEGSAQSRYPSLNSVKVDGKELVLLTFRSYNGTTEAAQSFVYDMETDEWEEWTVDTNVYATGCFDIVGTAPLYYSTSADSERPLGTLIQFLDGNLYLLDDSLFQDDDSSETARAITTVVQTPKYVGSENTQGLLKFQRELRVITDRPGTSTTMSVQWSDDDYATFNTAESIDINDPAARIAGMGSFYERAFKFTHTANSKLRLRRVESVINTGTS